MARWQHIVEGYRFMTGSLFMLALYQIRKAYVTVYSLEYTKNRFKPADESGRTIYTHRPDIGACNRYTYTLVHPYL